MAVASGLPPQAKETQQVGLVLDVLKEVGLLLIPLLELVLVMSPLLQQLLHLPRLQQHDPLHLLHLVHHLLHRLLYVLCHLAWCSVLVQL